MPTNVYCVSICFNCQQTQLLERKMDKCDCSSVRQLPQTEPEKCDKCNKKLLFIKICYKCSSLQIEDQELLLKQAPNLKKEQSSETHNHVKSETLKYSLNDIVID